MSLTLADLDREELIALAEKFFPPRGIDLAAARLDAAAMREDTAHRQWRRASEIAVTDARATKAHAEKYGYDDRYKALFEISKRSTRTAAEFWRAYEIAARKRERFGRELKRVSA